MAAHYATAPHGTQGVGGQRRAWSDKDLSLSKLGSFVHPLPTWFMDFWHGIDSRKLLSNPFQYYKLHCLQSARERKASIH
jgi:hypothetical protein